MCHKKLQLNIARLMVAVFAALLLLPMAPAVSADSGECGNGVTWELSGGVLTISGSGAINDYSEKKPAPWLQTKDTIRAVFVENGVTSVGDCAFLGMDRLTSAVLASSVKRVGDWAFSGCFELALLDLGKVEEIGQNAFERCRALSSVRLPKTLGALGYRAFYGCSSLVNITVPEGVIAMETSVFAYCTSLQSATILAGITELPSWTFYNCERLTQVTMAPTIENVGYEAFYDCVVEQPDYGHTGQSSHTTTTTQQEEDTTVITNSSFTENENGNVSSQVVSTKDDSGKTVEVTIDAVLENDEGWPDVEEKVTKDMAGADSVTVNVWLKGDSQVSGEDIGRFAGLDVKLIIRTTQGAEWYIDGNNLKANDLADHYNISYTLRKMTDPNKDQAAALDGHAGYILEFHGVLDFKVEVELPIGKNYNRQSAVFFSPEEDGYQRKQAVMIDDEGMAHFYLGQVESGVQYLIGINVPQKVEQNNQNPASDVIIPDSLKHEYPKLEQIEQIEYVVTGVKSSLGINIGQLTFFLIAGMIICAAAVGIVMRILYKRKLKSGYTPDMRYTDEI